MLDNMTGHPDMIGMGNANDPTTMTGHPDKLAWMTPMTDNNAVIPT
jgi:hypothetical protein